MMKMVNVLDISKAEGSDSFELLRISESEEIIFLFTSNGASESLHYCSEQGLGGYVFCNGARCVLCAIGRKKDERILMPVYHPPSGDIRVLPIPKTMTPHALLPQLTQILQIKTPQVTFIRREGSKYFVTWRALADGDDDGIQAIKNFTERLDAGQIDLTTVYSRVSNEMLSEIPEISKHMQLKGVTLNDQK